MAGKSSTVLMIATTMIFIHALGVKRKVVALTLESRELYLLDPALVAPGPSGKELIVVGKLWTRGELHLHTSPRNAGTMMNMFALGVRQRVLALQTREIIQLLVTRGPVQLRLTPSI
jgi:hypothetical protein